MDICRNAAAHGWRMTFVATGGGELEEDFKSSGVEFIRLQRRLPFDPQISLALRRIIKERAIEIVHSYQAVEGLHAHFACVGTNAKRILSFQGYVSDAKNRRALRFLIPRADANVAVSEGLLRWLREEMRIGANANFSVIYNGVDRRRLEAKRAANDVRAELGVAADALLCGMVANFNEWKDQMTICRALPEVFARISNAHFVFVGGRSTATPHLFDECVRFCCEQGIAARVHFTGKRKDVADILHALDVFALSSFVEGLPVALAEAMMLNVPAIVSDIAPLREASGDGCFARIFPMRDHASFARQLIALFESRTAREELAAGAKRWAAAQFGIEAHFARLNELYERVLSKN